MASVIAEFAVTAVQFYLARKELPWGQIGAAILSYGTKTIVMVVVGILLLRVTPKGTIGMLVTIVGCIGIYVLILIISKDSLLIMFKNSKDTTLGGAR